MSEPKPGDRVRVTYEATVYIGQPLERGVLRDDKQLQYTVPDGATIELIEPADERDQPKGDLACDKCGSRIVEDPSIDPVGTVRRRRDYPLSRPAIRQDRTGAPWRTLSGSYYDHDEVTGWEVIGTVPGTPAAEAEEPHEFKPSYSGMVCAQMVMRDGGGDACGRTPADPVHGVQ